MKRINLLLLLLIGTLTVKAQDELLDILNSTAPKDEGYASATFKSTRLINGHSIETRTKQVLEFVIGHRFGRLNSGVDELFGLDNASIRFALEYGITNNLNVGVGRSSFNKVYDGFAKYKVLRQSNKTPITLTALATATSQTIDFPDNGADFEAKHRWVYTYQVLMARKFNSSFSLQLMPTYMHRNLVPTEEDANDLLALGVGGRLKLNQRLAINAEYYHQLSDKSEQFTNAIAIGFDIETVRHVFQLHMTNAQQMNERFIGETNGDFFSGDIHFGFNVSRVFNIGKH